MRLRHLVVIGALLTGCGGDSTGPSTGTLSVSFDAASCAAGNAEIFVDGTSQGAFFWIPGQPRSLTVQAGNHAVGAREVGGSLLTWPAQTVNVPSGGTFSLVFTC